MSYCPVCGTRLFEKELEHEGMVPFCASCGEYRFPLYNVAVSMVVVNDENGQLLLVKQYRKDFFRLVAGYVNRTEPLEHAVVRELKEETGMTAEQIRFNRTCFYEPSNTLMCNFTAHVRNDAELNPNYEIDSWAWFSPEDAQKNLRPETLAGRFLNAWLEEKGAKGDESACTFEALDRRSSGRFGQPRQRGRDWGRRGGQNRGRRSGYFDGYAQTDGGI